MFANTAIFHADEIYRTEILSEPSKTYSSLENKALLRSRLFTAFALVIGTDKRDSQHILYTVKK